MAEPIISVVLQQPALAAYRVPVFAELAARPGIDLRVEYATLPSINNVEPVGFDGVNVPMRFVRIAGRDLKWHSAQWRPAGGGCDVLILSADLHYVSLVPALMRARRHGVGTVLWSHGYSKVPSKWSSKVRTRINHMADAVMCYNNIAAEQWRGQLGSDRVFVALNAIDQQPIQAARSYWLARPDDLQAFAHGRGLADGPVLLFVSRLKPRNRLELMVESIARLKNRWPGIKGVMIGSDGDYANGLKRLAAERGVSDRLILPGPIFDQMELAPWFLNAQLFCYPAQIGLSILHAFGYGLPVVTDDHPTLQNPELEALQSGVNGMQYSAGDADALAELIDTLLADTENLQAMGKAAHRTATEQFTLSGMVDGMVAAIESASGNWR